MSNQKKEKPGDRTSKGELLLFLIFGGVCLVFSQGRWPIPLATFAAYILLMRFFRLAKPGYRFLGFIIIHTIGWDIAYTGLVPATILWRLMISLSFSLIIGLLFVIDRWVAGRSRKFYTTLIFPTGLVLFEFLVGNFSPAGTGSSIANTFADQPAIAQIASITGWTGITFIVGWITSVVNKFWQSNHDDHRRYFDLIFSGAIISAILVFGYVRLQMPLSGKSIRTALIVGESTLPDQGDLRKHVLNYLKGEKLSNDQFTSARAHVKKVIDRNFQLADNELKAGAKIIVFPEANPAITPAEEQYCIEYAQRLAKSFDAYIGLGFYIFHSQDGLKNENKFTLIDPDGTVGWEYFKANLVPGSNHKVGDGVLPVYKSNFGKLSAAICFDMDFPGLMQQAGKKKIDILFGPSNDWPAISKIHVRMAKLRVIEQGYSLVRPTGGGFSLVTDPMGKTIAFQNTDLPGEHILIADVFTSGITTIYSIVGNVFSWLCVIVFFLVIIYTIIRKPSLSPKKY